MKKRIIKAISLSLIVGIVLSIFTIIPVGAVGKTSISLKVGDKITYYSNWNRPSYYLSANNKMVYCAQPDKDLPASGTYSTDGKDSKLEEIKSSDSKFKLYQKALYYGYGGAGFTTEISLFKTDTSKHQANASGNTPKAFINNLRYSQYGYEMLPARDKDGSKGNSIYYLMTHLLIAKIFYGDSFSSKMAGYLSNDYINATNELYKVISNTKLPAPRLTSQLYWLKPNDSSKQYILITMNSIAIQLQKVSANESLTKGDSRYSLSGAVYEIFLDKACKNLYGTMTTDSDGKATYKENVPDQTYYVREKTAPKGYKLDKTVYELKKTSSKTVVGAVIYSTTISEIPIVYEDVELQLKKVSANPTITNSNSCYSLKGAVYSIYTDEAATNKIGEMTTDENGLATFGSKVEKDKTYYAKETVAPKGYALDNKVYKFTDSGEKTSDGSLIYVVNCKDIPQNDPVGILLRKENKSGKGLEGAEFTVKYYDGYYSTEEELSGVNATRTWVFKTDEDGAIVNDKPHLKSGDDFYYVLNGSEATLPLGTITIQETKAPDGYFIDDKLTIRQITSENSGSETVKTYNQPVLTNDETTTEITKTDITGKKELEGANLVVKDESKNVIDEWVSTKESHIIKGLIVGKKYTLTETIAPDGYYKAETIEFVVEEDGHTKVVMKDEITKTYISKTDITGDKELEDAELKVTDDETNKVVDSWVSTKKPHLIEGLVVGKSYTLTETIAPNGYATTSSITFTVKDDGPTKVVMKDDTTKYEFVKVDTSGKLVANVTLQLLDKTTKKAIDEWVTDGKTNHKIAGKLVVGKQYILREKSAPKEYTLARDITFTVKDTPTLQQIVMTNNMVTGSVTLNKVDLNNKPLLDTEWKLYDSNDNLITVSQNGNGRYFVDEESKNTLLKTNDSGVLSVTGLVNGDYYFVETKSAKGTMPLAKKAEFTINISNSETTNVSITVQDNPIVTHNTGSNALYYIYSLGGSLIALAFVIFAVYAVRYKKKERI